MPYDSDYDQQTQSFFGYFPVELCVMIESHLNKVRDKGILVRTCKKFYSLFQPSLRIIKLLEHVVRAELLDVKKMIEANPDLLWDYGTVQDLSGRMIRGTAFQIALGAEDTGIWLLIEHFFDLNNWQNEKIRQFNQQFPAEFAQNTSNDFDFKALINIIATDPFSDDTQKALKNFRKHFTPNIHQVLKKGKHFDLQIYIYAVTVYEEKLSEINRANGKHLRDWRSLYCRQVIGYLQRLFPASLAQDFCKGFSENDTSRSLLLNEGGTFYPRDLTVADGLGFSGYIYFGNVYPSPARAMYARYGYILGGTLPLLEKNLNKKYSLWKKIWDVCKNSNFNADEVDCDSHAMIKNSY